MEDRPLCGLCSLRREEYVCTRCLQQRRSAARGFVQVALDELHGLTQTEACVAAVILAEREQRSLRERYTKRRAELLRLIQERNAELAVERARVEKLRLDRIQVIDRARRLLVALESLAERRELLRTLAAQTDGTAVPDSERSADVAPQAAIAALRDKLSRLRRERIAELLMFFPVRQRTPLSYQIGNLELPSSCVLGMPSKDLLALVALAHLVHVLHLLSAYLGEPLPHDMRTEAQRKHRRITRSIGYPMLKADEAPEIAKAALRNSLHLLKRYNIKGGKSLTYLVYNLVLLCGYPELGSFEPPLPRRKTRPTEALLDSSAHTLDRSSAATLERSATADGGGGGGAGHGSGVGAAAAAWSSGGGATGGGADGDEDDEDDVVVIDREDADG